MLLEEKKGKSISIMLFVLIIIIFFGSQFPLKLFKFFILKVCDQQDELLKASLYAYFGKQEDRKHILHSFIMVFRMKTLTMMNLCLVENFYNFVFHSFFFHIVYCRL